MSAYATTSVPVERSQAEIRKLLQRYEVQRLAFGEERDDAGQRWAAVTFQARMLGVRMRVPLKQVNEHDVRAKAVRARSKGVAEIRDDMYTQEERRIWRVLAWNLKARLVAVDEGLESFEEAFLPHLIDPRTNRTIYEHLSQDGHIELPGPLLALPVGADD
jgi:hypothetical protein